MNNVPLFSVASLLPTKSLTVVPEPGYESVFAASIWNTRFSVIIGTVSAS